MFTFQPGITYGWLYHPAKDAICIDLNSEEYEEKLKAGEWKTDRSFPKDEYESLSLEELKIIAKEAGLKGYGNSSREKLIIRIRDYRDSGI